jgi:hypothetical protein
MTSRSNCAKDNGDRRGIGRPLGLSLRALPVERGELVPKPWGRVRT